MSVGRLRRTGEKRGKRGLGPETCVKNDIMNRPKDLDTDTPQMTRNFRQLFKCPILIQKVINIK